MRAFFSSSIKITFKQLEFYLVIYFLLKCENCIKTEGRVSLIASNALSRKRGVLSRINIFPCYYQHGTLLSWRLRCRSLDAPCSRIRWRQNVGHVETFLLCLALSVPSLHLLPPPLPRFFAWWSCFIKSAQVKHESISEKPLLLIVLYVVFAVHRASWLVLSIMWSVMWSIMWNVMWSVTWSVMWHFVHMAHSTLSWRTGPRISIISFTRMNCLQSSTLYNGMCKNYRNQWV